MLFGQAGGKELQVQPFGLVQGDPEGVQVAVLIRVGDEQAALERLRGGVVAEELVTRQGGVGQADVGAGVEVHGAVGAAARGRRVGGLPGPALDGGDFRGGQQRAELVVAQRRGKRPNVDRVRLG